MLQNVTIKGETAHVPLYRDEVEVVLRALDAYTGPDKLAADFAARQLQIALDGFVAKHGA